MDVGYLKIYIVIRNKERKIEKTNKERVKKNEEIIFEWDG